MKKIIAAAFILLPAITWAHPGHGETEGYTIIHYFTEPQHALVTLGILAITAVYIARERKKNQSR